MTGRRRSKSTTPRLIRPGRAGNAGVIASFAIALAGILAGAMSAYLGERGAAARAALDGEAGEARRQLGAAQDYSERDRIVRAVLADDSLARLSVLEGRAFAVLERPRIIVVIDDLGLDPAMAERFMALPGPLTLSFLPYGAQARTLAARAKAAGAEVMLHLPMEPLGEADPGPNALRLGMTGADFLKNLEWNLAQFDGYEGVNNHMGSRLTADRAAMKTVLAYLKARNLFFLDSVTTAQSAARDAAASVGARMVERDVFLDAGARDAMYVREQLKLAERIALETGYAIAIGHPYETTIEALGPWLTTAPARGFDIVAISALVNKERDEGAPRSAPSSPRPEAVLAETPALRL